ncbi:sporulation protein YqfD [Marinicrinis lubricantis]|uniref:Sporulation protein YqfD n=1 Tax=Marinicrinis lubricantis TaxID=2086470 RepID=A0ABW1IUV7_9BACL
MQSGFLTYVQGSVEIEVRKGKQEQFINELTHRNIKIWNVHKRPSGEIRMSLFVSDAARLRPLLKQTGCRMHVLRRDGLPFLLKKIWRRKVLALGIPLFLAGIYILTSLVWGVHVTGNDKISEQQVLQAARKHGIYKYQWSFKLDEPEALSDALMQELPGVSWVGVRKEGTQIYIEVVESALKEEKPLKNPRHLISTSDAVITEIFTERGVPKVDPNTRVKKGDVLISGVLGDEENQQIVVAEGKVKGLVWHVMHIEVPLTSKTRNYTGNMIQRNYVVFGSRGLKVYGYGKTEFEKSEAIREIERFSIFGWELPIGWMSEKVMEAEWTTQSRTVEEAKTIGLSQAEQRLLAKAGEGAVIHKTNILHEKTDSGKVYMKVLFEVEQNIAQEQPIIQINQGE